MFNNNNNNSDRLATTTTLAADFLHCSFKLGFMICAEYLPPTHIREPYEYLLETALFMAAQRAAT